MSATNQSPNPGLASWAAVLFLCVGGTGRKAGLRLADRLRGAGRAAPARVVHVDTDPAPRDAFDRTVHVPLGGDDIEVLLADPDKYGPLVARIVRTHPELLDHEDTGNGSRTIRLLSQVAFLYHEDAVLKALREEVLELLKETGCPYVRLVVVGSTGGGAGSALSLLLAVAFGAGGFRSRLLTGLSPRLVHRPVLFMADPYAYADGNDELQARKILANIYAFRLELVELQRRGLVEDAFHIGLANDGGAVVDTDEEVTRVLGDCVYEYYRNYAAVTSFLVNYKVHRLRGRYTGRDCPEDRFPGVPGSSTGSPTGGAPS